jgi:hypothetical protein
MDKLLGSGQFPRVPLQTQNRGSLSETGFMIITLELCFSWFCVVCKCRRQEVQRCGEQRVVTSSPLSPLSPLFPLHAGTPEACQIFLSSSGRHKTHSGDNMRSAVRNVNNKEERVMNSNAHEVGGWIGSASSQTVRRYKTGRSVLSHCCHFSFHMIRSSL